MHDWCAARPWRSSFPSVGPDPEGWSGWRCSRAGHLQVLRLKVRRGTKTAILALTASMLTAGYFTLRDGVPAET